MTGTTDPLVWIGEGFFYGDTLQRAVNLLKIGKYTSWEFRTTLIQSLPKEIDKYTRWSRIDDPSWEANRKEAVRALNNIKKGKPFSYKGVQVDLY